MPSGRVLLRRFLVVLGLTAPFAFIGGFVLERLDAGPGWGYAFGIVLTALATVQILLPGARLGRRRGPPAAHDLPHKR